MDTSILGKADYTREEVLEILEGARRMVPVAISAYQRENRGVFPPAIKMFEGLPFVQGDTTFDMPPIVIVGQFLEETTRTVGSYRRAAKNLRQDPIIVQMAGTSRGGKGESPLDDAEQHFIQGTGIYILRTSIEGEPRFLAEKLQKMGYQVSVINAGDGKHRHPTQARLDALTILAFRGTLEGLRIGVAGDHKYGRTVHSLLSILKPWDPEIVSVPFGGLGLEAPYRDGLNIVAEEEGNLKLLQSCNVGYFTRVQKGRIAVPTDLDRIDRTYVADLNFLDGAKEGFILMHPGPRRGEVSDSIRRDPRVVMSAQAWFGIPERMNELYQAATRYEPVEGFPEEKPKIIFTEEKAARMKPGQKSVGGPERGTVIDHLPAGTGDMIKALLRKAGWTKSGQTVAVSDFLHPIQDGIGKDIKDIVVVHGDFLPDEAGALITLLAPKATLNHVRGDGTLTKIRFAPAKGIRGLCRCHNGDCITNHDGEAESRFFVRDGHAICYWCESIFDLKTVIEA